MSKIRNIQIDDFRIYNGNQEFSFSGSGELSNLMVIYAPNGYGKTSFFDAVEWCYSSKIRRFETDVLGQEINRRDYSSGDKILITNRQSFKNGKSGSVKISTADHKVIERTASERKGNKVDYKYDYKTISTLKSNYDQHVLDKLVKTNILTQDQIDEFLRHTKPDERFFQLQNFWPEGENAVSILRDIDSYINIMQREKSELTDSISKAEQQIKDFLNAEDQIAPLNTLIRELIEKSETGFRIEELAANVSKETYQAVLAATQTYIERAKLIEIRAAEQITLLLRLQNELRDYLEWLKNAPLLADNFTKLSNLAKLYADLRAHKDEAKMLDAKLASILHSQQKLSKLVTLIEQVGLIYKTVNEHRATVQNWRHDIEKFLHNMEGYRTSALNLHSTLTSWTIDREKLDQRLSEWDTELENYKFWTAEREKIVKRIQELKNSTAQNEAQINAKITQRSLLQSIAEKTNYENLPEADLKKFSKELKERNEITASLILIRSTIEKWQSDLGKSASLDETFERLITWGEEYVKNTDADHCPLCASKFKDVSDLMAQIEKQKSEDTATLKLKSDLDEAKAAEAVLLEQLAVPNGRIAEYVQKSIDLCQTDISTLQTQKEHLSSEMSSADNGLLYSNRALDQSLLKLQSPLVDTDNSKSTDFVNIKRGMQAELLKTRSKCIRLENVIKYKNHAVATLDNAVSILKNKVSAAENTIAILQSDSDMVQAEEIKEELAIADDAFFKESLEARLAEATAEQANVQSERENKAGTITSIQYQIDKFPLKLAEVEIPGLRLAGQDLITENQQKIANYKSIFKTFSEIFEPTDEFFINELAVVQKYLQSVTTEVKDLEELSIRLKVIEKNVLKNSHEEDIKTWTGKIEPLERAVQKVREARLTSEDYINNEINNYFNQDVINQIYSRIEPHPNLNQIKISPKVTERGPILDIKAVSNEEELDPSLYLSAGQLNVLSLSIFLANAFEKQNDEIDTIFMDDPIQNLSDINTLSFIDLIRTMITKYDRQIVISTHDENFYKLMRNKMPSDAFNVRYYEIESYGKARHIK